MYLFVLQSFVSTLLLNWIRYGNLHFLIIWAVESSSWIVYYNQIVLFLDILELHQRIWNLILVKLFIYFMYPFYFPSKVCMRLLFSCQIKKKSFLAITLNSVAHEQLKSGIWILSQLLGNSQQTIFPGTLLSLDYCVDEHSHEMISNMVFQIAMIGPKG